jgi:inorganic pyrophosphatase
VIEGATIAAGMAPGLWRARRRAHGFFKFRDRDEALVTRLIAQLESRVHSPAAESYFASDLDPKAVEAARACAEAAGVAAAVSIDTRHFEEVRPPEHPGLIVTNPPYGERLPLPRAGALFRRLGDWMVQRCGGWRAAILAADTPAMTQLGLRPSHRMPLMNGPISCRLLELIIRARVGPPPSSPPSLPPPPSQVEGRGESSITGSLGAAAASRDRCEDAEPWRFRPEEVRSGEPGGGERSGQGNSYRPGADGANDEASNAPRPGRPRARTTADQIGDFRRRLAKRFKHLAKWARRQGIEAFRVYDRDIPEIPLAIDWYAGWLHAAEYDRPHERTEIEHEVWLDRHLFQATVYPAEYGFFPDTLAEDGDPLDALVLLGEPTFPGCHIRTRPIAVLEMTDEAGRDLKVLCVPAGDPRWEHLQDIGDVDEYLLNELRHFFVVYKDLEPGKESHIGGWGTKAEALTAIADARAAYVPD